MFYLSLLAIIVVFSAEAMEQLSPRSKQVAHEMGQLFKTRCDEQGIAQEKQRLILGALMDTSAPTICQTVDDWNNFIVKGLRLYQKTYLGKVIDISSDYVIELWENEIRRHCRKSNKMEIVYKAPACIDAFNYLSEKTFAVQAKDHVYLYYNGQIIFEDTINDGLFPLCLNASGEILIYGKCLADGRGQLNLYNATSGLSSTIEIECLKSPDVIKPTVWTSYPTFAQNPAKPSEIFCLCATGFLYSLDIVTAQVTECTKAFGPVAFKNLVVTPQGHYVVASNDKTLKIWIS